MILMVLPGFALQKNGTPLQGLFVIMPIHGALPRAMNRSPLQGFKGGGGRMRGRFGFRAGRRH
ncbi:MAG: hypothetical protein ACR2P4_08750 [Gammaproteobacteria bacterium]